MLARPFGYTAGITYSRSKDEEKNERGGYLHKCTNKYAVQGTQANASDRDDGGGKG